MTHFEELQKGWSALNEELSQQEVVNDKAIIDKIDKLRTNINTSKRQVIQRNDLSIWIGIIFVILAVCTLFYYILSEENTVSSDDIKDNIYWIFTLPVVCITIFWDYWTKQQLQSVDPINSTVVEIMKRTSRLLRCAVYEIYFIIFLFVVGSILIYIKEDFYQEPLIHQCLFISTYCLLTVTATIYIRKYIFNPLERIRKNAEDLKTLE